MNRRQFILWGLGGGTALGLGLPLYHHLSSPIMTAFENIRPYSTNWGEIRIHALATGRVKVKKSHRNPSWGIPAILLDPFWTEWMPIFTWLIEHPAGNILVDTGENVQVNDANYFDCDKANGFVYRNILKIEQEKQHELPQMLETVGVQADTIRWVVLTHLHLDHVDGVKFFPQAEFILSKAESQNPSGNVPCLLPTWFKPRLIDYSQTELANFGPAYLLCQSPDVWLIPTPGHTHGHQSLLLKGEGKDLLIAGDTSFDQAQLRREQVAGICSDKHACKTTLKKIKTYCQRHPTIYLPSHDPESGLRLEKQLVFEA